LEINLPPQFSWTLWLPCEGRKPGIGAEFGADTSAVHTGGVSRAVVAWRGVVQRVTAAPALSGDRENGRWARWVGVSWAVGGSRPELGRKGEAGWAGRDFEPTKPREI
jgi:hypothetical protein